MLKGKVFSYFIHFMRFSWLMPVICEKISKKYLFPLYVYVYYIGRGE